MNGRLFVIGLGPGNADQITPEANAAAAEAEFFYGYGPYVDRLNLRPDQTRIASDNREEISRANAALEKAAEGAAVAVVSAAIPACLPWPPQSARRLKRVPLSGATSSLRSSPA